jgi:hypothetical protein
MQKLRKSLIFIFISVSTFMILVYCSSSTQLQNIWENKSYQKEGFKKILVFGMAGKEWKKKVYENEFGTVLKKYNVKAVIAWQVLPKGEELTIETFEKYFKDQNIDAVLVTRETGESTEETLYGGGTSFVAMGFNGFYISTSPIYRVPGYLSEEKIIYMDTKLFETKEGKLVWSATSQSYEPKSTSEIITTVSRMVVDELYQQGFIK